MTWYKSRYDALGLLSSEKTETPLQISVRLVQMELVGVKKASLIVS